jgi:hypothetical protein
MPLHAAVSPHGAAQSEPLERSAPRLQEPETRGDGLDTQLKAASSCRQIMLEAYKAVTASDGRVDLATR